MTAVDFPLAVGPVGVLFNVRSRRVMWTDAKSFVHSVGMNGTEYEMVANLGVYKIILVSHFCVCGGVLTSDIYRIYHFLTDLLNKYFSYNSEY